jgi:hypothetical protein
MVAPQETAPYSYWRPSPPMPSKADIKRFWSYVVKSAKRECWPWRTLKRGTFWWRIAGIRYRELSSRLAYRLIYKRDPGPREIVSHRCEWKACCNPGHLQATTQQWNAQDGVDRGMHPYMRSGRYRYTRRGWWKRGANKPGEGNGFHKLTDDAVVAIRERYRPGVVKQADLAAEFGVSRSTVSRVVRNDAWKHVAPARSA